MQYEYYLIWDFEFDFWAEHFDDFVSKYNEKYVLTNLYTLEDIYENKQDITKYKVVKVLKSNIKHALGMRLYPFTKEDFIS